MVGDESKQLDVSVPLKAFWEIETNKVMEVLTQLAARG